VPPSGAMQKTTGLTCDDCYFRRAELCAIPGNTPGPTFRAVVRERLAPPLQPPLVPLPKERPRAAVLA
jgi:hypothetical protein